VKELGWLFLVALEALKKILFRFASRSVHLARRKRH
jgi:hypothetical protein